ncbi:hypothetical protein [Vibrio parahaemolyticus]|uniref:hypothetical protein n=1 Tax=Vibrio parahaemolyticus TaxID=670 RepID=UPI0015DF48D0|nr:hypothetical protein [Vibrio parahaemolyticus]
MKEQEFQQYLAQLSDLTDIQLSVVKHQIEYQLKRYDLLSQDEKEVLLSLFQASTS